MTSRQLILLSALCVTLSIASVSLLILQDEPEVAPPAPPVAANDPSPPTPAEAMRINQAVQAQPIDSLPDLPPLPRSLQGSTPDVQLRQDADGNLLISADILHLFEFYLSALAEEPLEISLNRISRALAEQLQGQALEQARDLLKRYLDYRIALADLQSQVAIRDAAGHYDLQAIAQRQQQLKSLRQQHFSSEENRAFFAEQDSYDDLMFKQLQLAQNTELDAAQRQQALDRLEQQLPEPIRQAREQATRQTRLYELTEQMKSRGASAEELFQVRAEALGHEAATALAALDQRQADWDRRMASFEKEREAIRQSGLSAEDQQSAIVSLIERRFAEDERAQVLAQEGYP